MADIEVKTNTSGTVCRKCGMAYGRQKGYFLVSYATLYKGVGYMPYCKECVDKMYNDYLSECGDPSAAARQLCRKLDLYWNASLFNSVEKTNTIKSMMTSYISKTNSSRYAGKSYDDTLREEGQLWDSSKRDRIYDASSQIVTGDSANRPRPESYANDTPVVDDSIVSFWGPGYTSGMYQELQQRYEYWMTRFPQNVELDIGTEMLIKQICILEIDSIRDRAAGKPVDKYVTAINTIVGSLGLKPTQKKAEEAELGLNSTPLGVWLYRYENKRPLPEIDDDLKDSKRVIGFMQTWVLGHLCKMLGIKNSYCKMYEDEIARLRVEKPEYDDEDDDTLISDYLLNGDDADEQV